MPYFKHITLISYIFVYDFQAFVIIIMKLFLVLSPYPHFIFPKIFNFYQLWALCIFHMIQLLLIISVWELQNIQMKGLLSFLNSTLPFVSSFPFISTLIFSPLLSYKTFKWRISLFSPFPNLTPLVSLFFLPVSYRSTLLFYTLLINIQMKSSNCFSCTLKKKKILGQL